MASLVAPLVSGISTAASGSVTFVLQGTSTVAPVYSDAEGATAVTAHALDARGAIVRYVEARVTVTVYDSNGAEVTSFVWGTDARDARVENLGFTGPDATGAIVAGGRTTVDAILTSAFASLGATNWRVNVNGTPTNISTAIGGSAGLVYNVKAEPYSATGDGTTNDSTGVQAAINAAVAAGGGIVYFPTGDYVLDTGITIGDSEAKLTFLGDGVGGTAASTITQGTSGITMLSLGGSNVVHFQGLHFTADSAANTGTLISVGAASSATFVACQFSGMTGNIFLLGDSASTLVACFGCLLGVGVGSASVRIATDSTAAAPEPAIVLVACDLTLPAPGNTYFSNCRVALLGCTTLLGFAGASGTVVLATASTEFQIVGGSLDCIFTSGTVSLGTSVTMSAVGAKFTSDTTMSLCGTGTNTLYEAGCHFDSLTFVGTLSEGYSATRDHRRTSVSSSATSYTPSGEYMLHEVLSSGATMTINDPDPMPPKGSGLVIIYKNTGVTDNITPTFGSAYVFLTAASDVDQGKTAVYVFAPRPGTASSTDMVCISANASGGITLA